MPTFKEKKIAGLNHILYQSLAEYPEVVRKEVEAFLSETMDEMEKTLEKTSYTLGYLDGKENREAKFEGKEDE